MTYGSFGDRSDVHVLRTEDGSLVCKDCRNGCLQHFGTPAEMLVHLEGHRTEGDRVPKVAIQRLVRELLEQWEI